MSSVEVRATRSDDIPRIQAIYAAEVRSGLASFEVEPPHAAEMERRRQAVVDAGFTHLVSCRDGAVTGYAYTSIYRARPGYRFTCEDSVYVAPEARGQGHAGALLQALIEDCRVKPFRSMIAVIGDSANHASINLHRKFGFREVGVLQDVGYKLDRWVDSVIMQLRIEGSGLPGR